MSNETTLNEHEILISKKATFHKNCKVHITLKNNNGWENGTIEYVGADFFRLLLSREGSLKHELPHLNLFFLEVDNIEEYNEVRK